MNFIDFWVEFKSDLVKKCGFHDYFLVNSSKCENKICGEVIEPKSIKELQNFKSSKDFVILHTKDEKISHYAVKHVLVDAIYGKVNRLILRDMAERNIAYLIKYRDIVFSDTDSRIKIFSELTRNLKFVKKYGTPLVITSGAKNESELRGSSDMIAFLRLFSFDGKESKKALYDFQKKIVDRTEKKRKGIYIVPGVEKWQ